MEITGHTKMSCLIGSPTAHSGSPAMYNYCFQKMGLDWVYLAFDIQPEQVPTVMHAMKAMDIRSMNVTFPHKQAVVPFMDWQSDAAKLIGAVNMIVNRDGKLYGYNTDGMGYVADLRRHGIDIRGKCLVIAGAGGAATSIIAQCALDGAEKVVVLKRRNAGFADAAEHMRTLERTAGELAGSRTVIQLCDMGDDALVEAALAEADVFCNATNVGMHPNADASVIAHPEWFRPELAVTDIVYNPLETKLMREAKAQGVQTVLGGIGMLVGQGAVNFELMTGQEMPVQEVTEYVLAGQRAHAEK